MQIAAMSSMQPEININTVDASTGNKVGRVFSRELFSPTVKYLKRVVPEQSHRTLTASYC